MSNFLVPFGKHVMSCHVMSHPIEHFIVVLFLDTILPSIEVAVLQT
jgi:hypothetical protein